MLRRQSAIRVGDIDDLEQEDELPGVNPQDLRLEFSKEELD